MRQRQVALSLLSPSPTDFERGVELHADCLVAEPYSLGLHAPLGAREINRQIDAGTSGMNLQDLMEDHYILNWLSSGELRQEYGAGWEASGVSCLFINAGEEGNDPMRLLRRLARYTVLIDSMPELLVRGTSVAAIRRARSAGMRSICFALNGVPLSGNHSSIEDELSLIRVFAQLGALAMHLTYQRRNPMGDGCGEPVDGGLSHFGHAVVEELNRLGVIIDLAHTGWKTCLDVCHATKQPVMVSHSAVHALSGHYRAKPDEVIRAVVETGGIFGITNYPSFLGGSGDVLALLDHIDYMVRKFGEDSVAIGTDRFFKAEGYDDAHIGLKPVGRSRPHWEKLWPSENNPAEWRKPSQLDSLVWSNWPLFTVGMVQRGHKEQTIRKILGENLLRVAAAVWKNRPPY